MTTTAVTVEGQPTVVAEHRLLSFVVLLEVVLPEQGACPVMVPVRTRLQHLCCYLHLQELVQLPPHPCCIEPIPSPSSMVICFLAMIVVLG